MTVFSTDPPKMIGKHCKTLPRGSSQAGRKKIMVQSLAWQPDKNAIPMKYQQLTTAIHLIAALSSP
jgi:hypothetical protein